MIKGSKTKKRIMDAADSLSLKQGFDRTTMRELLAAAGVQKGAFYHYFESKEALGLAVLARDRDRFLAMLDETLDPSSPVESLNSFFAAALHQHASRKFFGGCLWGNTALEMSDTNERYTEMVKEVFAYWTKKTAAVLRAGQQSGDFRTDLPPEQMAEAAVALIEGGIMLSRVHKEAGHLQNCMDAIVNLVTHKKE